MSNKKIIIEMMMKDALNVHEALTFVLGTLTFTPEEKVSLEGFFFTLERLINAADEPA